MLVAAPVAVAFEAEDFEQAKTQAAQSARPILLEFYRDG
jgi:hypothetical protein